MSLFNEASLSVSKYLYAETPAKRMTLPFTMACWVYPQSLASTVNVIWGHGDTTDADTAILAYDDNALNFIFECYKAGGATEISYVSIPFPTFDIWYYLVGIITSGEARCAFLNSATGEITQGTQLTATTVSDLVVNTTGFQIVHNSTTGGDAWGGVAECWSAGLNADPSKTGTSTIDTTLIRQLAYYGPFSIPPIASKVWDYYSLRECMPGAGPQQGIYYGNGHPPDGVWTADAGGGGPAVLGKHPPLPGGYVTPAQYIQNLTI